MAAPTVLKTQLASLFDQVWDQVVPAAGGDPTRRVALSARLTLSGKSAKVVMTWAPRLMEFTARIVPDRNATPVG